MICEAGRFVYADARRSLSRQPVSMPDFPLRDDAQDVLVAVHQAGDADVYDLAAAVGAGPRQVQDLVRELDGAGLVVVSERGDRIACTPAGEDHARRLQRQ